MNQPTPKPLHSVGLAVAVFLSAFLVAVGTNVLCHNPNAWLDLLPKAWVSDKDREVLKDPAAANKEAYEKMCREAWERSQAQQPQNGWDQGWKK
jgi:hypothetical protein